MTAERTIELKLRSLRMRLKGYLAAPEATPEGIARLEQQIKELESK